MHFCN